jgi:hypothetical protein
MSWSDKQNTMTIKKVRVFLTFFFFAISTLCAETSLADNLWSTHTQMQKDSLNWLAEMESFSPAQLNTSSTDDSLHLHYTQQEFHLNFRSNSDWLFRINGRRQEGNLYFINARDSLRITRENAAAYMGVHSPSFLGLRSGVILELSRNNPLKDAILQAAFLVNGELGFHHLHFAWKQDVAHHAFSFYDTTFAEIEQEPVSGILMQNNMHIIGLYHFNNPVYAFWLNAKYSHFSADDALSEQGYSYALQDSGSQFTLQSRLQKINSNDSDWLTEIAVGYQQSHHTTDGFRFTPPNGIKRWHRGDWSTFAPSLSLSIAMQDSLMYWQFQGAYFSSELSLPPEDSERLEFLSYNRFPENSTTMIIAGTVYEGALNAAAHLKASSFLLKDVQGMEWQPSGHRIRLQGSLNPWYLQGELNAELQELEEEFWVINTSTSSYHNYSLYMAGIRPGVFFTHQWKHLHLQTHIQVQQWLPLYVDMQPSSSANQNEERTWYPGTGLDYHIGVKWSY